MRRLEAYIKAFGLWLPCANRREEVLEVSGNLWSKLESEERAGGTRMDDSRHEAFLKKLPHPLIAAHHYWPQQNWIDPVLLPVTVRFFRIAGFRYFMPLSLIWIASLLTALWLGLSVSSSQVISSLRPILIPAILLVVVLDMANIVLSIRRRS